ncbi:protease B nonderepressible form [Bachmanniomyces sp. S44760]|nr:protease B nonderepressible form [Bachmanniomyces sp. S44760]
MRERISYVHGSDDTFEPDQLLLDNDTLHIRALRAAKEDRLTFGLDELPQEVCTSGPPVVGETFTGTPLISDRFASSAAMQYHQNLSSLTDLFLYIQNKICGRSDEVCHAKAIEMKSTDYLDVDYDTISQTLVLSVFHSQAPSPSNTWNGNHTNSQRTSTIEVGVLANKKPTEPEELSMEGLLTVLGEDDRPNPTLFSFPSRHHPSPSTYSTHFLHPTGLHPTLRLTFPSPLSPPLTSQSSSSSCSLHTYLTLPSALFADKYQLSNSNPLFLSSNNLKSIRSISGETDLEAPDWVITKWGSNMLVELAPPPPPHSKSSPGSSSSSSDHSTSQDSQHGYWHADIPLHLRYLPPTPTGLSSIDIPWPVVFWACPAQEGSKMTTNPFDRVNLGYDGLFGTRTMFYHLQPLPRILPPGTPGTLPTTPLATTGNNSTPGRLSLLERIEVPVLRLDLDGRTAGFIERGTMLVVGLGVIWVLWKLWVVVRSEGLGSGRMRSRSSEQRKVTDGKKTL